MATKSLPDQPALDEQHAAKIADACRLIKDSTKETEMDGRGDAK
jgi:hypothetical protein